MPRTSWISYSMIIGGCIVLLGATSCGRPAKPQPAENPKAKIAAPASAIPKPERKLISPKPAAAPGKLVLSTSAETGSRLYRSWPLIVSAHLWRKVGSTNGKGEPGVVDPVTIKAKQGSWREALVLEAKNASGAVVVWPFHPVKQPDPSVTLGVDDTASAEWWLEPSDTQSLVAGNYTVTVAFHAKLVDGLPNEIGNDSFRLTVAAEPSPLGQDTESEKRLQMALFALYRDDARTANDLVDQLLRADPQNIGGFRLKSKLLLREGKPLEAVKFLDDALNIYFKKYPKACPPAGLFQERDEILQDVKPETVKAAGKK